MAIRGTIISALAAAALLAGGCGDEQEPLPDDIAGVCDDTGVVLGLMPHPENHVLARQHPRYGRGTSGGLGLALFEQGVRYAKGR